MKIKGNCSIVRPRRGFLFRIEDARWWVAVNRISKAQLKVFAGWNVISEAQEAVESATFLSRL